MASDDEMRMSDTVVHPDTSVDTLKVRQLYLGESQGGSTETCKPGHKLLVLFFVVGIVANTVLFDLSWKCRGDDKLIGNRCVPVKDRPPVEEQMPEIDWKAEKPMLDAIFAAYSETFPARKDMHRPQLFPKKAETAAMLKKKLFKRRNKFIRLENRYHHSEAYEKVQKMVEKLRRGENVTITAIGGSPTARGGFMYRLADFFRAFRFKGHVNTFNMGHGAQDGNHAAFLLDEFLPPNTDLVIWEFSINDAWGIGNGYNNLPDDDKRGLSYLSKRNFLHMLGNTPNRPAVMMVYLWPKWKLPENRVLEHGSFPFLLGSVDMLKLRQSFTEKPDKLGFTIHDHMHPSLDGDLIIGEMLKDIVAIALLSPAVSGKKPDGALLRSRDAEDSELASFKVTCIRYSDAYQARFQEFIDFLAKDSALPRSWSALEPIFGTSFQLVDSQDFRPALVTKTSASRLDRRYILHVPLCTSDKRMRFTMDPSKDFAPARTSRYLLISSERNPYRPNMPIMDYELLELTLADNDGRTKVLKSQEESWDRWELNGKPVQTVHGPGPRFSCGLQMGRAFKLEVPGFHISSISICARGEMTLQWLSVID